MRVSLATPTPTRVAIVALGLTLCALGARTIEDEGGTAELNAWMRALRRRLLGFD